MSSTVHFSGGVCGVLSVAFLSYPDGILIAWDKKAGLVSFQNLTHEKNQFPLSFPGCFAGVAQGGDS